MPWRRQRRSLTANRCRRGGYFRAMTSLRRTGEGILTIEAPRSVTTAITDDEVSL